jgi:hypothetical protein
VEAVARMVLGLALTSDSPQRHVPQEDG